MKTKLTGTTLPVLEIGLEPGDVIVAEPGEFSWMTENVQSEHDGDDRRREGHCSACSGRALSGGGLFMTEYSVRRATASSRSRQRFPVRSCKSTSSPATAS